MSTGRRLNGTALAVQRRVQEAHVNGEDVSAAGIARQLELSKRTVERAFADLVAAGRLDAKRRTPTIVAAEAARKSSSVQEWAERVPLDSSSWRPVLVELAAVADRYGWVRSCGVDYLMKVTTASERTVKRALAGLATQGVITAYRGYERPTPERPAVRKKNSYQLNAGAKAKDAARAGRPDHPGARVAQAELILAALPWWKRVDVANRRRAVDQVARRLAAGWPAYVLALRLQQRQDEDGQIENAYAVFRARMRKLPIVYNGPVPEPGQEDPAAGRPRTPTPCPMCGVVVAARAYEDHVQRCTQEHQGPAASPWDAGLPDGHDAPDAA